MEYPIVSLRPPNTGTSLSILPRLTRKPVWLSKHELEMCSDDSSDWPNLKKYYIHLLVLDLGWCKIVLRRVLEQSFSQRELPRCTYRPVPDFYSLPYWFLLVLIIDLNTANVSKEARALFFSVVTTESRWLSLWEISRLVTTYLRNTSFQITWSNDPFYALCKFRVLFSQQNVNKKIAIYGDHVSC